MFDLTLSSDESHATLRGQLVFGEHMKFRQMARQLVASGAPRVAIDVAGIDFIDSAGLGMLLLLRQEASSRNQTVVLRNSQGQVKRMFEVSRFDKLFAIEP